MKLKFTLTLLLLTLLGYSQISESNKLQNEAIELIMKKDYANSLSKINKAIAISQTNADYYYIRGNAYEKLTQIENAKADYLKAIQLNPKHGDATAKCAIMYGKQNNMERFCFYAKKACELGSSDACAMYSRFCK